MKRYLWMLLVAVVASCADDPSRPDDPADESELTFLRLESASVITVRQASFWAVKGTSRKLIMRYAPERPGEEGERFLEFEVGSNTLLARPNGVPFLNGDSILITAQLDASNRVIVHFEPSGLTFNPLSPAKLEISYARASRDLDGDRDVDDHDRQLELGLRFWKQERTALPWLPLLSLRIDDDEIEARVLSFTAFAMASE